MRHGKNIFQSHAAGRKQSHSSSSQEEGHPQNSELIAFICIDVLPVLCECLEQEDLNALSDLLQKLLPEQGILETRERWQAILKFFGEDEIAPKLDSLWASSSRMSSGDANVSRWEALEQEVARVSKVWC